MILSQEQIDFFNTNGYLKWGPLLEQDEIAALREQYDIEFAPRGAGDHIRNLAGPADSISGGQATATQQMLQIMQISERNIHFRKLAYDSRILNIVQDLIGPNIMLFHDQAVFKPAFTGGPIHWHQDNAYWQCQPATLVSCWLTLDDVDRDNGAMQVIPASHLTPARHDRNDDKRLELKLDIDESQAVSIDLPAGGCMFHHCQTLHHTRPNETERQRRAFAIHFMQPGTRLRDGEIMHVSFSRPLLRAAW